MLLFLKTGTIAHVFLKSKQYEACHRDLFFSTFLHLKHDVTHGFTPV